VSQRIALPASIAWRYLRGRRSRLLTGTAVAALGSASLGTAAMVVAMSLMNGYTEDLQGKMLQSGAIIVSPAVTGDDAAPDPRRLMAWPEVEDVTFAAFAQGSLLSPRYPSGLDVTLRGVEPGRGRFGGSAEELAIAEDGVAGALLGADLATRLHVATGDRLRLVALGFGSGGPPFRYRTLRVAGTFATGFSQFDQGYVVVDRRLLDSLGVGGGLYEVAVRRPGQVEAVRARAEALLGEHFLVRDWRLSNPGLFTALRLQKWALFLMLGLIVVVSTFNVGSTLVVLVREKLRDVGVLAALGLRPAPLRRVFLLGGLYLGALGTTLGVSLGAALSWAFTRFGLLRFEADVAEIYFLSAVPFRVRAGDLFAVAAFSLGTTLLACLLASRRAARLDPAAALRYE
jgi:lipoprotein-releasing system permease protein